MQEKSETSGEEKLTQQSFDALLSVLHPDRDKAGTRYEGLRQRLTFFFTRRQFLFADGLADEVLNRIAQQIQRGESIGAVEAYAYGIARHVAQEELRRNHRVAQAATAYVGNIRASRDTSNDGPSLEEAMEDCLNMQEPAERELLRAYYTGCGQELIDRRRELAAAMNLSASALRKRVFRLRQTVEDYVRARFIANSGGSADGQ